MAAAFNQNTLAQLQGNVRTLFYRRQKIGKLHFTFEEYLDTFVPAEARDCFRDVAPWVAHETRTHRWTLEVHDYKVNATMRLGDTKRDTSCWRYPPPVPRDLRIQPDAMEELKQRIYQWAVRGGDVSREFGRVNKVLEMMNAQYSRVAIRYYWPTILAIASEHIQTKGIVQELQELRTPARLKSLPLGLSLALKQTAETIATAKLIPHDVEEDESAEVTIDIVTGQNYIEHFSTFYGMG